MSKRTVTRSDHRLVQELGDQIIVGEAFAFMSPRVLGSASLRWVARLLGSARAHGPQVIPLLGRGPIGLPGGSVEGLVPPRLRLTSITSDKGVYQEGRDVVSLLALSLGDAGSDQILTVQSGGVEFTRVTVRLDAQGAATTTLRGLPAGGYEVRFQDADDDEPSCSFTVAEYRLAGLVATLEDRRLAGDDLTLQIGLESYGAPVEGEVDLELHDRGRRVARQRATARGGRLETRFKLEGEGPHSVEIQVANDPARTATVPLVGSRAAERSQTVFSSLGTEVMGSLLPAAGATEVRGIWLEEGAICTSPIRLDRVNTRRARLIAAADLQALKVVVIDPTVPTASPGAVDPTAVPHPGLDDSAYREGERLAGEGSWTQARAEFQRGRAAQATPHPNYAYWIACCHVFEGDHAQALAFLRQAFRDGWRDIEHLRNDEDLAPLRDLPAFQALSSGSQHEVSLGSLAAGESVEVDLHSPAALLAVGAFAQGRPWEGWATVIAPSEIALRLVVPEQATPGEQVTVTVEIGDRADDASVYLLVKDARLPSPDTPGNRLAGRIKAMAESAGEAFSVGHPTDTLVNLPSQNPFVGWSERGDPMAIGGEPFGGAVVYSASMPPGSMSDPFGAPAGAGPPPDMMFSLSADDGDDYLEGATMAMAAPARSSSPPPTGAMPALELAFESEPPAPPTTREEPEVLLATLLEAREGQVEATLRLPEAFADYVVEAFVVRSGDWAPAKASFRAEKDPFLALELPAFVHAKDTAMGTLVVGCASGRAQVSLRRDGQEVPLLQGGAPIAQGAELSVTRTELTFLVQPGEFEAVVTDLASQTEDRGSKRVEQPGCLRRVVRTVYLLEPGQTVSRAKDTGIVGLRVLPGIERSNQRLLDATMDYSHACCEQTAAIMLAAAALFVLCEDDRSTQERAEACVLAGVRRELQMWKRGRGFTMYPHSRGIDTYYGPKAARYLWNLALLKGVGGALEEAVDQALEMARDTTLAYQLSWPPSTVQSCEEAYAVARFSQDPNAHSRVLNWVRARTADLHGGLPRPKRGGAVVARSEGAYAAAVLLRAGQGGDLQRALTIANAVLAKLDEQGRLYSTQDSVGAIALMEGLREAGVAGGAGRVRVDGAESSTQDAAALTGDLQQIEALEGVAAVEVLRIVEEDWAAFSADVSLRVALEVDGRPGRQFSLGQAVDLSVTLQDGYQAGDLLWVCLPDALSRLVGGGQVKRFAVDFEGADQVRVPLATTGLTVGPTGDSAPQRFAVCVRNMFEEERAGNPGLLEVTVEAPRT